MKQCLSFQSIQFSKELYVVVVVKFMQTVMAHYAAQDLLFLLLGYYGQYIYLLDTS